MLAETKPDKTKASDQKKKPGPIYKPVVAMATAAYLKSPLKVNNHSCPVASHSEIDRCPLKGGEN